MKKYEINEDQDNRQQQAGKASTISNGILNALPNVMAIAQTSAQSSSDRRITFNKRYIISPAGIIRLIIIVSQFATWVSAAAVPKIYSGQIYLPSDLASTRDACLAFSIVGFFLSIAIYVLYLLNIPNLNHFPFNRFPFIIVLYGTNIVWIVPTFVIAIVCALREASLHNPNNMNASFVNSGAFASASFFGFLSSLLYGVDNALLWFKRSGLEMRN